MTYKTHVFGGIGAAVIITTASKLGGFDIPPMETPEIFGVFVASILGSTFPDIDQPKSRIGQKIPVLSNMMRGAFGHRGFCHSLLFLVLIHYVVSCFISSMAFYSLAFCIGAGTHLFFDMFNWQGVPLLWPLKIRVKLAKIRTESPYNSKRANMQEKLFRGVIFFVDAVLTVNLISVMRGSTGLVRFLLRS